MTNTDRVFAGTIPEIYDTYLVPLLFEGYAADLARRVAQTNPTSILETAAGSGVVTRALAPRLGPQTRYVVSDLNQAMLDRAASRQGADQRIHWQQADALALPFADDQFDMVFCQFGAMFFPDKIAGYREARRILTPGGRFLFNVWDRIEENEFARVVTDALRTLFPEDPPQFLARTPHGYHDKGQIEAELRAAGFTNVQIETHPGWSDAPNARSAATAYCQGTPLRNEIEARTAESLEAVTTHAARAIAEAHGLGPVRGKIQAHVIVAQG